MTTKPTPALRPTHRDTRRVRKLFNDPAIRVFLPQNAHEGGIFRAQKGGPTLLERIPALQIDSFVREGALFESRTTKAGRLFRPVPVNQRCAPPRTARDHRNASWLAAEKVFAQGPDHEKQVITVNAAESPIGWLARRRDSQGRPYLTRDEVAAAERLRADFERGQLGESVTQNWKKFLTAGVSGGRTMSAQEREVDGGATAARQRLGEALDSLGPGLADVALRVCCYLEGIVSVESAMHWSARSGKVVLKIALQRLAAFYEQASVRNTAKIEAWQSDSAAQERDDR